MTSRATSERSIVIIGGGIIGCTTAYYLTRHPSFGSSTTVTLIEPSKHGVAQGASGKAGGLVAKWAYPKELAAVSFAEHVELAEEHGGEERWGWRFVECGSWEGRGLTEDTSGGSGANRSLEKTLGMDERLIGKKGKTRLLPNDLDWVTESLTDSYSTMAPKGATAQVHPYLFTTSMLDLAKENGVKYISGMVETINRVDGSVTGVVVQTNWNADSPGEKLAIPATHVVLSAGPWSPTLLPSLPISAMRAHSVTIRTREPVSPYVLFTEIAMPSSEVTPEIYARPDGDVYACGKGDSSALPSFVDDVEVDQRECDIILEQVTGISEQLREGDVQKRQACFLPNGGPIIGEAKSVAKGLIIATGHTCWGICNAPGTAKAVSELVMDGKIICGNLKKLSPNHYL